MKNNLWCGCIVHRKTHCTQILRIMRLTVFFLLFIIFETYALNSYSQNQKVTMNKGTATLAEIIRQIEKQTDYLFIYNEREVSLKRKVSISTQDGTVASLLLDALHGTEFSYTMEGKHIILTKKQAEVQNPVQNRRRVTGQVKEYSGEVIVGCNVSVKGTTIGTITDINGNRRWWHLFVDVKLRFIAHPLITHFGRVCRLVDGSVLCLGVEADKGVIHRVQLRASFFCPASERASSTSTTILRLI